jgi:hypothetical protein
VQMFQHGTILVLNNVYTTRRALPWHATHAP